MCITSLGCTDKTLSPPPPRPKNFLSYQTQMNSPKHEIVLPCLLILVLLTTTLTSAEEDGFLIPIAHVSIINNVSSVLPLTTHCKSKNDDLGIQVLPPGANFSFHFRPSFWGDTLFACDMEWNGTQKHFDIYETPRDHDNCKCYHYYWNISPGGPCMYNFKTQTFGFCYVWPN